MTQKIGPASYLCSSTQGQAGDQSKETIDQSIADIIDFNQSKKNLLADDVKANCANALKHMASPPESTGHAHARCGADWKTEFGCAIIYQVDEAEDSIRINLLGLDNWQFRPSQQANYHAVPTKSFVLDCGEVRIDDFANFKVALEQCLTKKKKVQRTPSYVQVAIDLAIKHVVSQQLASLKLLTRGGMSDVGQHTGSMRRSTSWPLVEFMFRELLRHSVDNVLIEEIMLRFRLYMLLEQVAYIGKLEAAHVSQDVIDVAASIADQVAAVIVDLTDRSGWTAPHDIVDEFLHGNTQLKVFINNAAIVHAAEHHLERIARRTSPLHVCASTLLNRDDNITAVNVNAVRDAAIKDIGMWASPPNVDDCSPDDLLCWIQELASIALADTKVSFDVIVHIVSTVQSWSYRQSHTLLGATTVGSNNAASIFKLLQLYSDLEEKLAKKATSCDVNKVEWRSRRLITVWIGTCLMHKQAVADHPLLLAYGIALRSSDLQYMVITQRAALTSITHLAKYLDQWKQPDERTVFALRDGRGHGTIDFATAYAAGSAEMVNHWHKEIAASSIEIESRWKIVTKRKAKAQEIREEIEALIATILHIDRQIQITEDDSVRHLKSSHERALQQKSFANSRLEDVIRAPNWKPFPFPSDQRTAGAPLFFLLMPNDLRSFAKQCVDAQALLTSGSKQDSSMKTRWARHYNSHRLISEFAMRDDAYVQFIAVSFKLPARVGPPSIDNYDSKNQCAWYPDFTSAVELFDRTNPFTCATSENIAHYTEVLVAPHLNLQWVMSNPSNAEVEEPCCDRGNKPFSRLDLRPDSLDKQAFLQIASLRSYPLQQLPKLAAALSDRTLPLCNDVVRSAIRQALYQVGVIQSDLSGDNSLLWKDFLTYGDGQSILKSALSGLADHMHSAQGDAPWVRILSEIAGYIANFDIDANATNHSIRLIRSFVAMGRGHADSLVTERDRCGSADSTANRIQECLLLSLSILCFANGPFIADDAVALIGLNLRLYNGLVHCRIGSNNRNGKSAATCRMLMSLLLPCRMTMACRAKSILDVLNNCGREVDNSLTDVSRIVFERTPTSPMQWSCIGESNCFEATDDANRDHYCLNVITGRILLNAIPPGGLPSAILCDPLYRRSFGECDFLVSRSRCGTIFRTIRPMNGCHFDFALHVGGIVECTERHIETALSSTLVNLQNCVKGPPSWSGELPPRLINMHSHWYCNEHDAIMFRPVHFNQRSPIAFVYINASGGCHVVPPHDQRRSFGELIGRLGTYPYLVDMPASIKEPLIKFEDVRYIHASVVAGAEHRMQIHFARYDLSFEEDDKHIFQSVNHRGQQLASNQQMSDSFPAFNHYLLLEPNIVSSAKRAAVSPRAMIIPAGNVVCLNGVVRIEIDDFADHDQSYGVIYQHRRLNVFKAETRLARLQLACIFAASSTAVRDTFLNMTGAEAAIDLVRQCYGNAPLSDQEFATLDRIMRFSVNQEALGLVCDRLACATDQIGFLVGMSEETVQETRRVDRQRVQDAMTTYNSSHDTIPKNCRRKLSSYEIAARLGRRSDSVETCWPRVAFANQLNIIDPSEAFCSGYTGAQTSLDEVNRALMALIEQRCTTHHEGIEDTLCSFPLDMDKTNRIATEMYEDLQASYLVSVKLESRRRKLFTVYSAAHIVNGMRHIALELQSSRIALENLILGAFTVDGIESVSLVKILYACNRLPSVTICDLLRISIAGSDDIHAFAPCLSKAYRDALHGAVIVMMQMYVLEDRLALITDEYEGGLLRDESLVSSIMSLHRDWSPFDHPYWLAFEVEQGLQIRPAQYVVAKHLIDNDNIVSQLNMGQGKTRVILPMLIMHEQAHRVKHNVRLFVLPALLSEASSYLFSSLSNSVLRHPMFVQPYCRDVDIDKNSLRVLNFQWRQCRVVGGFQLLAPEHHLSMTLKAIEFHTGGRDSCHEADLLNSFLEEVRTNSVNILDESDVILHHRYQLIYSIGEPAPLASADLRAKACQAILSVFMHQAADSGTVNYPAMLRIRQPDHDVVVVASSAGDSQSSFSPALRLLVANDKNTDNISSFRVAFRRDIVRALMCNPPFNLRWLSHFNKEPLLERIIDVLTDRSRPFAELQIGLNLDRRENYTMLLIIRGLLAYGILEHCLEQRYRVQYGTSCGKLRTKPTRLAVPYRAADVPTARSEFSHPDVAITLTMLAYYQQGLTPSQIAQAVRCLIDLGPTAQKLHYALWLDPLMADISTGFTKTISAEQLSTIDDVRKLDLCNANQLDVLHSAYSLSTAAVNFYVNNMVFERELVQFPQHIEASAWTIADQNRTVGFSGTNDNARLLPIYINQVEPDVDELRSTNGRMLDCIIQYCEESIVVIGNNACAPLWQEILNGAICGGHRAIIDTGSLLAGVSNEEAANFVVRHVHSISMFSGVIYFDTAITASGCWMMIDMRTRSKMAHSMSPISDADSFVIFDDARCRGTDMKMRVDASAALTIGPALTKDKLMQGAGRLRQLGHGQRLCMFCTDEVHKQLVGSTGYASVRDVLRWVMTNTVKATASGVTEWAMQGLHHTETRGNPHFEIINDNWNPEAMFADAITETTASKLVASVASIRESEYASQLHERIVARSAHLGSDVGVTATRGSGQECERENEIAHVTEEEEEVEVPSLKPFAEPRICYDTMLSCTTVSMMKGIHGVDCERFDTALSRSAKSLEKVRWCRPDDTSWNLYCTGNFTRTVILSLKSGSDGAPFLRPAAALLKLHDGNIVLLSDREADGVLAAIQRKRLAKTECLKDASLCFLSRLVLCLREANSRDFAWVTSLRLYNGCTNFSDAPSKNALMAALSPEDSHRAIRDLIASRGMNHHFDCSTVESLLSGNLCLS